MADTARLDFPYLSASQAQKEVMHNVSLDRLDVLVQCAVLDRNLSTPPASPPLGATYIVGPSPTGVWVGHANDLALYTNLQWQLIAPLPGFQCWVIDEAVLVYWSGTAWTIMSSGGGGATTFLGLTDTPESYTGQAGKTLLVNPGETALAFGTSAGAAPVDAGYVVSAAHAGLSAERVLTDNSTILWDLATAGQVRATVAPHGLQLGQIQQIFEGNLLGRADPLFGDVHTIGLGTGLSLDGGVLSATGGGGSTTFLALSDTPDTYTAQALKLLRVNAGATALEYTDPVSSGASDFLGLTDTPDTYATHAGKVVAVNAGATGLEFQIGGGATAVPFRGCLLKRSTNTSALGTSQVTLTWDTEDYDTDAFHSTGTNPSRITIPAGITKVRLTCGIQAGNFTAASTVMSFSIVKNGSVYVAREQRAHISWTDPAASVVSGVMDVVAGDYFEVIVVTTLTSATVASSPTTFFACEVVEPYAVGTSSFLLLTDTPDAYTGQAGKVVQVNAGATALEFVAQDPELAALSLLTSAADRVPYYTGSGTAALATFTAAGRTLAGAADAAAQRTALGLGTMAQQDAASVAITGGQIHDLSVLTVDNQTLLVDNVTHGVGMGIAPILGRSLRAINVEATGLLIVDSPTLMVDPVAHGVGVGTNGASGSKLAVAGTTWLQGIVGLGRQPQSGNWLVIEYQKSAAHAITLRPNDNDTGGFPAISFQNTTSAGVGSISTTATATAYNTSSDIRLKHAITALTGALGVVQALRPVAFRWNQDDSQGHGFLAHELQREIPDAVTGEADAVNEDGSVKPQQVDHSRLVPWLVAALQETLAQVQALTARVQSLEEQLGL